MNTYKDLGNGTTELIITKTKNEGTILVDTADVKELMKHSWYIKDKSSNSSSMYAAAKINNKTIKLHRFLMNPSDDELVDHINRNTFDNRRINLRVCSKSTNNLNFKKRTTNTSGRTGVYRKKEQYCKDKNGNTTNKIRRHAKWFAQVTVDGKKQTKSFSVDLYGEDGAYNMAVQQRETWEKEYNILTEK